LWYNIFNFIFIFYHMKKLILSMLVVLFLLFLGGVVSVSAEDTISPSVDVSEKTGTTPCQNCTLTNPLAGITTPQALLGKILQGIFGVTGSLALVMFVLGGLTWMTSAGNPEKVKKGRDMLIWAAIGLFVVFSAYTLVTFVLSQVGA